VCSNLLREIVELSIVFIKYWKFILYYWNWNRLENSKVLCCVFLLVWHKCLLSVPFNGKRAKKLIANHQKLVTGRILAEWGPSKIRPYDHFPFCINVIVCVKSDFPKVFFLLFRFQTSFGQSDRGQFRHKLNSANSKFFLILGFGLIYQTKNKNI
jgi:hypothetical protein